MFFVKYRKYIIPSTGISYIHFNNSDWPKAFQSGEIVFAMSNGDNIIVPARTKELAESIVGKLFDAILEIEAMSATNAIDSCSDKWAGEVDFLLKTMENKLVIDFDKLLEDCI